MVILVTGTPGTGKTFIAKKLAKKYNYIYLDINKVIVKFHLSEGYDKKIKSKLIDEKKLVNVLIKLIKIDPKVIIDGHMSHYVPARYVEACIVIKCDIKILKKRLQRRNYSKQKIRDNLDSEIFDIILNEAKSMKHKIYVIDSSEKIRLPSKSTLSL